MIINCTRQNVVLYHADFRNPNKQYRIEYPAGQYVARCVIYRELSGHVPTVDPISENSLMARVYITEFGEVEGLPDPQPGTLFIVPRVVAEALRGQRTDLIIPYDSIRNRDGEIIGCRAFTAIT